MKNVSKVALGLAILGCAGTGNASPVSGTLVKTPDVIYLPQKGKNFALTPKTEFLIGSLNRLMNSTLILGLIAFNSYDKLSLQDKELVDQKLEENKKMDKTEFTLKLLRSESGKSWTAQMVDSRWNILLGSKVFELVEIINPDFYNAFLDHFNVDSAEQAVIKFGEMDNLVEQFSLVMDTIRLVRKDDISVIKNELSEYLKQQN